MTLRTRSPLRFELYTQTSGRIKSGVKPLQTVEKASFCAQTPSRLQDCNRIRQLAGGAGIFPPQNAILRRKKSPVNSTKWRMPLCRHAEPERYAPASVYLSILCFSVPLDHPVSHADFGGDVLRIGGILFDLSADVAHVHAQDLSIRIRIRPPDALDHEVVREHAARMLA